MILKFNKTLLWDITNKCNLRCKHCYNAEKYFNKDGINFNDLKSEDCKFVIDLIKEDGFDHIHLLGGEPLIRDDIFDIISYAKNKDIYVSINTNGTLLSANKIDEIINSGISQITISLDSTRSVINDNIRGKGSFNQVVNNIRLLSKKLKETKNNIILQIATVITKVNVEYIDEFPELLKDLGVDNLNVLSLYKCGNTNKNKEELVYDLNLEIQAMKKIIKSKINTYPELYIQLDCKPIVAEYLNRTLEHDYISLCEDYCFAGDKIWLLDSKGYIYPCSSCDLSTSNYCKAQGMLEGEAINILNLKKFNDINHKAFYKNFKNVKQNGIHANKVCSLCEFNHICKGTCPLNLNNDFNICSVIMEKEKEYFNEIKDYKFEIPNNILIKTYNDKSIVFKLGESSKHEFYGWKSIVINEIKNNKNIESIYNNLKNHNSYIDKIELCRFILDLNKNEYINKCLINESSKAFSLL